MRAELFMSVREDPELRFYDIEGSVEASLSKDSILFLGPGENTRFYLDKIPADGSIALHHVCVYQTGIAKLEQKLNAAGYPTALSGHTGIPGVFTTRFKYFDTREVLGFYLEITEYKLFGMSAVPGERIISTIARLQNRSARHEQKEAA